MSFRGNPRFRWMDLTEEEKKRVHRMRNAESARRSRRKKKEGTELMEHVCQSNKIRIQNLENWVRQLYKELDNISTSSETNLKSAKDTLTSSSKDFKFGETRPDWFGDAF